MCLSQLHYFYLNHFELLVYLISLQQPCRALHQLGRLQRPHHQTHPGPGLQAIKTITQNQSHHLLLPYK